MKLSHSDFDYLGLRPQYAWEEAQIEMWVKWHGMDGAKKKIQEVIDAKEKMRRERPEEYKRRYCGL